MRIISAQNISIITISAITAFNINPDGITKRAEIEIPQDVSAVLNKSCFGCHNTDSKNEKGKGKLTIDELTSLPTGKLVSKLNKIAKEISEGEMPPEKFAKKFPDKVPTKAEKKLVAKWAKSTAKGL